MTRSGLLDSPRVCVGCQYKVQRAEIPQSGVAWGLGAQENDFAWRAARIGSLGRPVRVPLIAPPSSRES